MAELPREFHEEWKTVGRHRIMCSVRDGAPGKFEWEVAKIAVGYINRHMGQWARLLSVFHDDTHGQMSLFVATTDAQDELAIVGLEDALRLLYHSGFNVHIDYYQSSGRESHDHYDHNAYLWQQHCPLSRQGVSSLQLAAIYPNG